MSEHPRTYTAADLERELNQRTAVVERVYVRALREAAHALVEVHGKGTIWRDAVLTAMVREVERDL